MAITLSTIYKAVDKFSPVMRRMQMANASFATKAEMGLRRVNNSLRTMQRFTGGVVSRMFNLRNAAFVAIAAMGAKKLYDAANNIAKLGDEAAKTSRMIGLSAEALQELRFAADRQGVTTETLTKSLMLLNRNVGDVQAGQGMLTTLLKRTNPELLKQLKNVKNNEEAFSLMLGAIEKAPNQMQKASLAQAAFGRGGQEMLKLFEAGSIGIEELREQARKFGGVIGTETANKMEAFIDAQTNMKFAMTGLKTTIITGLMPTIQKTIEGITNWTGANKDLIKEKTAEWADKISGAIKWLSANFERITKIVKFALKVMLGIIAVNAAFKVMILTTNILKGAFIAYNFVVGVFYAMQNAVPIALAASSAAMKGYAVAMNIGKIATMLFSAALWLCPITWIVAGIIALVAGIVLLVIHWDKVKAKMDEWSKSAIFQILKFANIFTVIIAAVAHFQDRWEAIKQAFKGGGIIAGIKAIGKTILSFIFAPVEAILKALTKIPKIGSKFQGAADWASGIKAGLDEGMIEDKPVNIQKANNEAQTNRYEEITKEKMELELTNKTDKNINVKSNPALIPILGMTR